MVGIKTDRDVNHMGSDLGYKHNGNMCGNPNRLGHKSVTYTAQLNGGLMYSRALVTLHIIAEEQGCRAKRTLKRGTW